MLFQDGDVFAVWNSFVVAGTSTVIAMFLGTLCAYSLARSKSGSAGLANWIISQRMIPPIAVVFPIFLLYAWLHWVDTYGGVILLYTAFNLPYVIWMMRGYILDIPIALEESALSRWRTQWQVLWRVAFPWHERTLRDGHLYLRVRLERLHIRARTDAYRKSPPTPYRSLIISAASRTWAKISAMSVLGTLAHFHRRRRHGVIWCAGFLSVR